jgi:hypothetical protein
MCTMIATQIPAAGCGKAGNGWYPLGQINVSYDHPFEAAFEHALNLDFVNEALGPGARVAVELDVATARRLVAAITAVLEKADQGGFLGE